MAAECPVCGGIAADESPCCLFCWFSGRYFETVLESDERRNLLSRIRALSNVNRAQVWHQGNGLFALVIELEDGRLMMPGAPGKMMIAGVTEDNKVEGEVQDIAVPAIPPVGENWRIVVATSQQTEDDLTLMPDEVDDEGLVRAVKEVSELNAAI